MAQTKEGVIEKSFLRDYVKDRSQKSEVFKNEYLKFNNRIELSLLTKELRKSKNLTQRELAKLVKKPQSTIARIENGTMNPSVEMLEEIAKATNHKLKIEFVSV